ncbi:hypothetical protein Aduo_011104 [Ancylostoma duodenale]
MPEVHPFIRVKDRDTVELVLMFVSIAGIPLTFIALVIILTKTPPQMKTYKWIIVNLTVTSFLTDIVICFLFDPIPLFPEVACYSKTWIANVGKDANYILLCVSIIMLQLTLSGTLVAFIYRMNSLRILSETFLVFANCEIQYTTIAIYTLSLIPIVFVLITGYKPSNEMRDMLEKTPELKFLRDYGSYLATDKDDWNLVIFQVIWLSSAFAIVALCFVVAVAIITQLHRKRQFMSSKSLALHRSLTIHLLVQILIPVATTLIPMLILFCTRYMEVPFGADFWNLVISQTVALHSPLNTVATILATRHYRTAFVRHFKQIPYMFLGIKSSSAMNVQLARNNASSTQQTSAWRPTMARRLWNSDNVVVNTK